MPLITTLASGSDSGFVTSGGGLGYSFTTATFTPGTSSGLQGPTIAQARAGVGSPSWAAEKMTMTYPGYIEWTVPATANYTFTLAGAQAGGGERYLSANNPANDYTPATWLRGGRGAIIRFNYNLIIGEKVGIVIGQYGGSGYEQGNSRAGGGGGGTWLYTVIGETLIAVAGGGGGGGDSTEGLDASVNGGSGQGGVDNGGGAGGGWLSNGANTSPAPTTSCYGSLSCRGGAVKPSVGSYGVAHSGWTYSALQCHFDRFGGFGGGATQHDNYSGGGGGYTGGNGGSGGGSTGGTSYVISSATSVNTSFGLNGTLSQTTTPFHGYMTVTKN